MNIKFVSDYFVDEVSGGAETVDSILINLLSNHHNVVIQNSKDFVFDTSDLYIVSNFTQLDELTKKKFKQKRYFIIEHDHKYVKYRNPSRYENNIVPADEIINRNFYDKAEKVFCQSAGHAKCLIENLLIDNVYNFGCSYWSDDQLSLLSNLCKIEKKYEHGFIEQKNPIKCSLKSYKYCLSKGDYLHIKQDTFNNVMTKLAECKKFVFFPQVYESFCRLAIEARMLNCSVITNKNLGCFTENKIRKLKGAELISYVRKKQEYNFQEFLNCIDGKKSDLKFSGKRHPTVSLITSMYKGERYIRNFLDNIVNQTVFEHCELLIIDAASPENEYKLIEQYTENHKNIKYVRLDKDPGIYGVWNIGAKMASGKYLSTANLDDIRALNQIEVLVNCLEKNPHIDLAYSECYVTKHENQTFEKNSSGGRTYPTTDFSKQAMVKCLPGCMPVWRKSMHDNAGYFDESFKYAGDHEMWLRAVRNGSEFKRVTGVHGLYYMNPNGISTSEENESERYKEEQKVFWEYTDLFGINSTNRYREYFSK